MSNESLKGYKNLINQLWESVGKRLLLRNCVEPEIGEYILECLNMEMNNE